MPEHGKNEAEKKRNKGIHSLKNQITLIFISLLFLSILAITLINHIFLERYYNSRKTDVLLAARESLSTMDFSDMIQYEDEAGEEGSFSYPSDFERGSSRQNLSWVVMEPEYTLTYCYPDNDIVLRSKIFGYAYGVDEDQEHSRILEKNEDNVVQLVYDRYSDADYLECWGQFDSGYYFLIRTPLESIKESASISNTFYVFVGIVTILISGILIYLVTRRITRPISELTTQSEKMSSLQFDVRYTAHAGNEIDQLGENFNHMSEQLETTISELKTANIELQRDIEDKIKIDEMRKEFLDNVSHELKTPIALIQGYAEGLKEGINDDPDSTEYYCDVIIDESAKMNKLVKNLLTLNQLESGRDAPMMEHFDLTSLIRGVLSNMDIMAGQTGVEVRFLQEEPVYVWADEFKTEEVVTNYLSNAFHHAGGEKVIEIRIHLEEDCARVTVFNTGSPIPEEDLPNLWNKFYKVDKARTRAYGGSGIGLSIVKAIIEGMQQQYGVNNYENGVEFWFTLDRRTG